MKLKFPEGVGQFFAQDGAGYFPNSEGVVDMLEEHAVTALRQGFKITDPWSEEEVAAFTARRGHLIALEEKHFVAKAPESVAAPVLSQDLVEAVEEAAQYVFEGKGSVDEVAAELQHHFKVPLDSLVKVLSARVEQLKQEDPVRAVEDALSEADKAFEKFKKAQEQSSEETKDPAEPPNAPAPQDSQPPAPAAAGEPGSGSGPATAAGL